MRTAFKESAGFAALLALLPWLFLGPMAGCAANPPQDSVLDRLQGTWEGYGLGRDTPTGPYVRTEGAITITIAGDRLHYYESEDSWFDTTFELPADTKPWQLHATIQESSTPDDFHGDVVIAFFEIEGETLTLGGVRSPDSTAEWPKSFDESEDTMTGRYELRKVTSQK